MGRRIRSALGIMLAVAVVGGLVAAFVVPSGPSPSVTLTVLAGSDLKGDLDARSNPVIEELEKQTGIRFDVTYAGALDASQELVDGNRKYDLAWLPSDHYLNLLTAQTGHGKPIEKPVPIMRSPVILAVTHAKAVEFGWAGAAVTWADILQKASEGKFHFALSNPASSHAGFAALTSVASAFDRTGRPLLAEDIDAPRLISFFRGQVLTAGSAEALMRAYQDAPDTVDGIFHYESRLLALKDSEANRRPMDLIYPTDGVVYSDYPLMLMNPAHSKEYHTLVNWLLDPRVQAKLMAKTGRRPVSDKVALDTRYPGTPPAALNLPDQLTTAQQLIFAYLDEFRRPARTIFVIDVSTSMRGSRINALKQAFADLAGKDTSPSGRFSRFRKRERITIIPFAEASQRGRDFTILSPDPASPELTALTDYVDQLMLGDGTAIYDALFTAYASVERDRAADEGYYTSIVLMTDGERNVGMTVDDFLARFGQLNPATQEVKTFVVPFGEAQPTELCRVAVKTRGRMFVNKPGIPNPAQDDPCQALAGGNGGSIAVQANSLRDAFKEIRGYQ